MCSKNSKNNQKVNWNTKNSKNVTSYPFTKKKFWLVLENASYEYSCNLGGCTGVSCLLFEVCCVCVRVRVLLFGVCLLFVRCPMLFVVCSFLCVVRCFVLLMSVVLLSGVLSVVLVSFLLSFGTAFHFSDFRFSCSSKLSDHTTS